MRFKIIAALLLLVAVLLSAVAVILILKGNNSSYTSSRAASSISGYFDINGLIPDGASITLTQKVMGSATKPVVFASNLPVSDRSAWSFNKAVTNKSYEIQAQVLVNGSVITVSNLINVTAPADDEALTLNIGSKVGRGTAVISGNIDVNGYIPPGATINIEGRKLGSQKFTVVARNLQGKSKQFLSYSTAVGGTTYEVQGVLLDSSGNTIGTSNILTVSAPALNELLTINSSATPPTPTPVVQVVQSTLPPAPPPATTTSISGNINLNGAAPANSRIVIFQQAANAPSNSVAVNNVPPADGSAWTWSGATNSTWYTLVAVLKQHNSNGTDTDIATSAPITVAAPATNVVFTLNSSFSLSAPGGSVTVNCQTYNGGPNQNTWNVVVTFTPVAGAQSYWYQIGNTNGGSNITNTASQSNIVSAVINNDTTYYARFAYANVPVAPLNSNQYSPFSSATSIQCSN